MKMLIRGEKLYHTEWSKNAQNEYIFCISKILSSNLFVNPPPTLKRIY